MKKLFKEIRFRLMLVKKLHTISNTNKALEKIFNKAYETGTLTDREFRFAIMNMTLKEYEYILDTGTPEMANAEFILRLKGKEKKMHKVFWSKRQNDKR